MGFFGFH